MMSSSHVVIIRQNTVLKYLMIKRTHLQNISISDKYIVTKHVQVNGTVLL